MSVAIHRDRHHRFLLLGHDTDRSPCQTNDELDAQVVHNLHPTADESEDCESSAPSSHHSDSHLHQTQQQFINVSTDLMQLPCESCSAPLTCQEVLMLQSPPT